MNDLTEEFSCRAQNYKGGQILFLLDGTNVAAEGYMFARAEKDPVTHALETVREIRDALPGMSVAAAFWSREVPFKPVNLDASPVAWMRAIPKGAAYMIPALQAVREKIGAGELETPLHIVAFTNMGGVDDSESFRAELRSLRDTPGVALDMIVLSDVMLRVIRDISAVEAEDPAHPVGNYRVLTPGEYAAALRDAVYGRVGKAFALEDAAKTAALKAETAQIGENMQSGHHRPVTALRTARFGKS